MPVAQPDGSARTLVVIATVTLVLFIGYVDYLTGPDIGMSLLYLPPIVAVAWFHGRRASLIVALTAAVCWFVADYLIRVSLPISLWNGLTRLVIFVSQAFLIAALRDDRRREAALARTDPTTGLANSRAFREALTNAIQHRMPLCVVSIDLDNFKEVNDRYGHQAGDEVLERTGRAMRDAIGPNDFVARIGGDEFALLLIGGDDQSAEKVGRRILENIRQVAVHVPDAPFGASIGFATSQQGLRDPEQLLQAADNALYAAKRARARAQRSSRPDCADPLQNDESKAIASVAHV